MVSYYKMYGRFGNILKSIYTVYYYCKKYNIPEEDIVFNGYRFCDCKYCSSVMRNYIDFFVNIKDKFVMDENVWKDLTKDNKYIFYKENINYGNNVTFQHCRWKYCSNNDDYELFGRLFYNKNLFDDVVSRYDLFKDRIAIHVRRTDFLKFDKFIQYVYSEEKCHSLIKPNEQYIIFSDDIEWCQKVFKYDNCIFMDKSILKKDWEHFIIMCLCKQIIKQTYSSFSTCASYINKYLKNKGLL